MAMSPAPPRNRVAATAKVGARREPAAPGESDDESDESPESESESESELELLPVELLPLLFDDVGLLVGDPWELSPSPLQAGLPYV